MAVPPKHTDLHGNVPDTCPVVLLLIDAVNDLEWEGGERLLEQFLPAARRIAALKQRAREHGIPAVYVNDNFGRWRSDLRMLVDHCLQDGGPGRPVVELLRPDELDYFVLKPKHSAFYASSLEILLEYLGARLLILTGITADICVRFTANDAFMRDYHLVVPGDCVASLDPESTSRTLDEMKRLLVADVTESSSLDLDCLLARARR